MEAVALVLAAGEGERLGHGPKAFLELAGKSILQMAVDAAGGCPEIGSVIVAVPAEFEERAAAVITHTKPVTIVAGGVSRQESVRLALRTVAPSVEHVVSHDAARPFAAPEIFTSVLQALDEADGAVAVLPPTDTVKRVERGWVVETIPREEIRVVQTPQAFVTSVLRECHERAAHEGMMFTDDAALLEWAGYRVRTVPGEPVNFKITTPADLARAEAFVLENLPDGAGTSRA